MENLPLVAVVLMVKSDDSNPVTSEVVLAISHACGDAPKAKGVGMFEKLIARIPRSIDEQQSGFFTIMHLDFARSGPPVSSREFVMRREPRRIYGCAGAGD